MASLYDELGGDAAVDAAVDVFYRYVLSDERIAHWFEDVDMDRQAAKQKAFMTMAFGGPHHYTGADMRAAHAPLVARGLGDADFDAVAENLGKALNDLEVAPAKIAEVLALVGSLRNDVLGRDAAKA